MSQNGTIFEQGGGSAGPQGESGTVTGFAVASKIVNEDTEIADNGSVYILRRLKVTDAVQLRVGLDASLKIG
jgi:hypothetical protein